MFASRAGSLVFGLGLMLGHSVAFADDLTSNVPLPPEAPLVSIVEPEAGPLLRSSLDELPMPPVAAIVVDAAPASARAVPDPERTGSVEEIAPPAAPVVTFAESLTGALELRLADPKLPLPPRLQKRDREALAAFYAARKYQPLWLADGAWNAAGRAVADRLGRGAEDGLDAAEYPVPNLSAGARPLSPAEFAEAELKLGAAAYLYARDARGGRIEPSRLSGLITPKLDLPALEAVLAALATDPEPGRRLQAYNPAYPGYAALRAKLADIRANRPSVPMASTVAPRRRAATSHVIAVLGDADVPEAAPISSVPPARLESDIVANMERWRWLPTDVANRYIAVNVPEFRLRLMQGGRVAHETRVITGKPETPTPIFSGTMEYAIVNPSWFIPPSIMKKEILPGLAADPSYAARRGYEVVRRGGQISVRQPPGERNALGFIKFMFPNNHAVYLHDTPNRSLFAASRRSFSHGCVRVERPFELAEEVLGHEWTETRLRRLIGRGERTIFLPAKLPVHLTYFTVSVDEFGGLRTFDDLYGYNRRVRTALGLGA